MKKSFVLMLMLMLAGLSLFSCPGVNALPLVRDGQPLAKIVIATEAPEKNRFAAEELQHFIKTMSGATLPILKDDQPELNAEKNPLILIGKSRLTDKLKIELPNGFSPKENREGFLIRTMGDNLILAGNDDGPAVKVSPAYHSRWAGKVYQGSLFAVYDFLERLGCRWFFPGELGEIVPEMKTIEVGNLDIHETPSFMVRGFWTTDWTSLPEKDRQDLSLWFSRNKYLPYGSIVGNAVDGSIMHLVPAKQYFEAHPEYFAMDKEGKRGPEYLCLSNPDVLKLAVEKVKEYFKANPNAMCYGFAPPDGQPMCWCKECQANNGRFMMKATTGKGMTQSISDGFYLFFNKVADEVKKEYPDRLLVASIYSGRIYPPQNITRMPDNTSGHLAFLDHSVMHRMGHPESWQAQEVLSLVQNWTKVSDKIIYRPYVPSFMTHCQVPLPMTRNISYEIPLLKKNGVFGMEWQGWCAWSVEGINSYLRGKLLWNSNLDSGKLLDDYYAQCYGKAAPYVRKYFEGLEDSMEAARFDTHEEELIPEIFPVPTVEKLNVNVALAVKAVSEASPIIRKRVEMVRLIADHLLAYVKMREAERNLEFAAAVTGAEKMLKTEEEMQKINTCLVSGDGYRLDARETYGKFNANFSAQGKKKQYQAQLDLTNGKEGELVARIPKAWQFTTDPYDEGYIFQWYQPSFNAGAWKKIETGRCWEVQGYSSENRYPYTGIAWYRTQVEVPDKFVNRKIVLFCGGINEEAWVWVNGRLVGYQPYHCWWERYRYVQQFDITQAVVPGKENIIAIRVLTDDKFGFGGIFRRPFIYSPLPREVVEADD